MKTFKLEQSFIIINTDVPTFSPYNITGIINNKHQLKIN